MSQQLRLEIEEMVKKGNKDDFSHVIICYDESYKQYFPRYVSYNENIKSVIKKIVDTYETEKVLIIEVYNYNLNIDNQLRENCSCHILPIVKKKIMEEKLNIALEYASEKHNGQFRKDGTPYIYHPIRVADYVSFYKDSSRIDLLKMCSYLHDTLEDTNTTYEDLLNEFGPQVAGIVLEVTNDENLKRKFGKERYLSQKMVMMSSWALIIKLCDRLDNVTDLATASEEFRIKYMNETIGIINSILYRRDFTYSHLNVIKEILNRIEFVNEYYNYHDDRIKKLYNSVNKIVFDLKEKDKIYKLR